MTRSIRFRYNPVFLPEYLSTVLISIPISATFMAMPLGGGRAAMVGNPHLAVAVGMYLAIAAWLIVITALHRRRYGPVIFHCLGPGNVWIDSGMGDIDLPSVTDARQSLGKFFGRVVRRIHIEDTRGQTVTLCDAIFDFDAVRALLAQLLGKDIPHFPPDEPGNRDRVRASWRDRHRMFPATETLGDVFSRLSWRALCLLPVAVMDVVINLLTHFFLWEFRHVKLMVYSAPLSLLASGFISRYVYYYMFSSTTMNKEWGVSPKK